MTVLDAAYWAICVVLVVSGVSKLVDPSATDSTLAALGIPAPRNAGRFLGVVEVLLGAAGLMAAPGEIAEVAAVAVAATYGFFTIVVLAARSRGLQDCGCIGTRPRPPTLLHALANLLMAAVALGAAMVGPVDLATGLGSLDVLVAVAVGLGVAVVGGAVVALL